MTDLVAIVARDADYLGDRFVQAAADRRALLALLRETRDALADPDVGLALRNATYGQAQTHPLVQAHNSMQTLIDRLAALDTETPA